MVGIEGGAEKHPPQKLEMVGCLKASREEAVEEEAPKKKPPRSQWTLKGAAITPELRTRVKMAARQLHVRQVDWVAGVLEKAAMEVLTGEESAPLPPVAVGEKIDQLAEMIAALQARDAEREAENAERFAALEARLVESDQAAAGREEAPEPPELSPLDHASAAAQGAASWISGVVFGK